MITKDDVCAALAQVPESMSLERAYIMFRNMGLRHLLVVDDYNRVKGIVTRKDLMGFKLDEAVSRALQRVDSCRHLGESSWLAASSPVP
jgi:CBS domain containing-hemolysin-like protein